DRALETLLNRFRWRQAASRNPVHHLLAASGLSDFRAVDVERAAEREDHPRQIGVARHIVDHRSGGVEARVSPARKHPLDAKERWAPGLPQMDDVFAFLEKMRAYPVQ